MILWIPSQWRQTLSIRVFSQAHIQHLTANTTKISKDLSCSSNPRLLGRPNLKICVPTENFDTYEHDQLPSALTYICLRTQLKGSQLKSSWTLSLCFISGGNFCLDLRKETEQGSVQGLSVLEELFAQAWLQVSPPSKVRSGSNPTSAQLNKWAQA